MPIMAAMSPPALTWWYCVLILRRIAGQHLASAICGLAKRSSPRSRSGLKVTIGTPRRARVLQVVQHARAVGADVLAEEEDRVGLSEVVQDNGADRDADAFGQRDRGAFRGTCSSSRAGCWCRTAARTGRTCRTFPARRGRRRRKPPSSDRASQFLADIGNAVLPGHRDVGVRGGVPPQRLGQPPLHLQVVVCPLPQLGDGVRGKKFRVHRRRVISHAVALAPFSQNSKGVRVCRFGPGAAHAGEAVRLVLMRQEEAPAERHAGAQQDAG